jgi:hypothetical protein
MALLGRDAMTNVELPTVDVDVPEMGGTIRVRALNAGDMMAHYAAIDGKQDKLECRAEILARVVVLSVIDEDGERIFAADEWPTVIAWGNAALQRVAQAAMKLNAPQTAGEDGENFLDSGSSSSD